MSRPHPSRGPFRADQIREGDRYELSNGHPIECLPAGRDHAASNVVGAEVLDTDPDVEWTGVDAGYSPEPGTLRAPDVAVGKVPEEKEGWLANGPPLAVEYASVGQDEAKLQEKIRDLLAAGTRYVWVVRLVGPRRVEVYEPEKAVRTYGAEEALEAPGILRNPVPVPALFDRRAAHEASLRNLLQRHGYESLDAVRHQAVADSILTVLDARGLDVDETTRERILASTDRDELRRWLERAASASSVAELFREAR